MIYTVYCNKYLKISSVIKNTRMHSSRMRTARSLPYGGGLCSRGFSLTEIPPGQRPPRQRPLGQRPPWTETPLDRDRPGQRPPGQRPPLDIDPLDRDLLDRDPPDRDPPGKVPPGQRALWSCDLWCMLGQRPPSMDRILDTHL